MNDAIRQSAIEDLIADVIDHLDKAEIGLHKLHKMQANKMYGLTWDEFMQRFFGKSRKWLYRQLHAAEGIRKLNELGVSSLGQSSAALQAFAEVPDELTDLVYSAAQDEHGMLTSNRVYDTLHALKVVGCTGAVETADGDMLPVRDVISGHVNALAAGRKSERDNCRWIGSRLAAEIGDVIASDYSTLVYVIFDKDARQTMRDLQGKQVFISIGIANESADDKIMV